MAMTGFLDFFTTRGHARARWTLLTPGATWRRDQDHRWSAIDALPDARHRAGYNAPRRDGRSRSAPRFVPGGVNFSIFSQPRHGLHAGALRARASRSRWPRFRFPTEFRIGNVFAMTVFDLDFENIEYGYRMDGPVRPGTRATASTDRRSCSTRTPRRSAAATSGARRPNWNDVYQHRGRLVFDDFDWEDDRPLEIPIEDLVIYEMHVRGFTRHPSSRRQAPGHLRRPPREDSVPEGARRQLPRADADLRVRRVREQPAESRHRRAR